MKSTSCLVLACLGLILYIHCGSKVLAATDTAPSQETRRQEQIQQKMDDLLSGKKELPRDTPSSVNPPAGQEKTDLAMPESPNIAFHDQKTMQAYQQALQAYYTYRTNGLSHRSKVFAWQLFSAKLLFVVVLALVFAGVYFAAVQFHRGLKNETGTQPTEFSASPEGIKISSPVLGVIILALSLGFFYLYLVHVFPIEEIL